MNTDAENLMVAKDLADALRNLTDPLMYNIERVFVIGGEQIYKKALKLSKELDGICCKKIHMTKVKGSFECDTFFPAMDDKRFVEEKDNEAQQIEENGIQYRFVTYTSNQ
jgi:dihydrofolate reductase